VILRRNSDTQASTEENFVRTEKLFLLISFDADEMWLRTIGMAIPNMPAQQEAFIPDISEIAPAMIPPNIPPTSNRVDRFPACCAEKLAIHEKT